MRLCLSQVAELFKTEHEEYKEADMAWMKGDGVKNAIRTRRSEMYKKLLQLLHDELPRVERKPTSPERMVSWIARHKHKGHFAQPVVWDAWCTQKASTVQAVFEKVRVLVCQGGACTDTVRLQASHHYISRQEFLILYLTVRNLYFTTKLTPPSSRPVRDRTNCA